ncbi:unnamed protein product, partial [Rotaria sp. Silwood1]
MYMSYNPKYKKQWVIVPKPSHVLNNSLGNYSFLGQPTMLAPQFYQQQPYEVVPTLQYVDRQDGVRFRIPRVNLYDLDDIPTEYRAMLATNYPPRRDDDIDGWFDYFQGEVAVYKQAIR